jgi:hypothetical protein
MLPPTVGVRPSFDTFDPARPDNHFDAYVYDRQKQNNLAALASSPPIFTANAKIGKELPVDAVATASASNKISIAQDHLIL